MEIDNEKIYSETKIREDLKSFSQKNDESLSTQYKASDDSEVPSDSEALLSTKKEYIDAVSKLNLALDKKDGLSSQFTALLDNTFSSSKLQSFLQSRIPMYGNRHFQLQGVTDSLKVDIENINKIPQLLLMNPKLF